MRLKSTVILVILGGLLFSIVTSVSASSVRISDETFRLGQTSLIADGILSGLGQQDVNVILNASGIAVVTCINEGGNEAPGQNNLEISATGQVLSSGNNPLRKNGKSQFSVEATPPGSLTGEDAVLLGCPNVNSTARIDFVYYTDAKISVVDIATGVTILSQSYACTTTRTLNSVSCIRR